MGNIRLQRDSALGPNLFAPVKLSVVYLPRKSELNLMKVALSFPLTVQHISLMNSSTRLQIKAAGSTNTKMGKLFALFWIANVLSRG